MGARTVSPADLCRMYLWRFAIEHAFRFLKQHLGLNTHQSTHLQSANLWMYLCATVYYQLLLLRPEVQQVRPAWHPRCRHGPPLPLTPRQVQRQALPFLLGLGSPARSPQPSGKGSGRPTGYRPLPRPRYRVVRKTQKRTRAPAGA